MRNSQRLKTRESSTQTSLRIWADSAGFVWFVDNFEPMANPNPAAGRFY